jgi:hypothetical protein
MNNLLHPKISNTKVKIDALPADTKYAEFCMSFLRRGSPFNQWLTPTLPTQGSAIPL